jgi:hypothetical protein
LLNQAVDVEEYGAVAFTINVDDFRKFWIWNLLILLVMKKLKSN